MLPAQRVMHFSSGTFVATLTVACGLLFVATSQAQMLEPDSPAVKAAIEKGLKFLDASEGGGLGQRALVGLTLVKAGRDGTDPHVEAAVKGIQNETKKGPTGFNMDVYSVSTCIMFLVAHDSQKYRSDIETLCQHLRSKQKAEGAWGYPADHQHGATCDTSMTQYAILSLWEAQEQADVITQAESWDKVATWLLLTQSVDGGHPYQGVPAPTLEERTKQGGIKDSMTLAAIGSLYIVKDLLGLSKLRRKLGDEAPDALRPYETEDERKARLKTKLDPRLFSRNISAGNNWISRNYTMEKPNGWLHYSLYALERYESLKEFDTRTGAPVKSPGWYQQGARFLLKTQKENGAWESQGKEVPDTCFSVLFLLRSMLKTLAKTGLHKFQGGMMAGGVGLPDGAAVRVRNGAVVVEPLAAPLAEVLRLVRDAKHPQYAPAREALADWAHTSSAAELTQQAETLTQLASSGPAEIRVLAVEGISRSRSLDQVPLLIHLLEDPNGEVVSAAQLALRNISRKYSGVTLNSRPSETERRQAIAEWKQWFAGVRPEVDVEVVSAAP